MLYKAPRKAGRAMAGQVIQSLRLEGGLTESNKNKKVFSHLDRYINYLWKVTGFSIPVLVFLSIKLEIPPPPIFLLVMGTATTITGLFLKFKPVTIGGIGFFLFAIFSTFVTGENTLLVSGAAIICCYLIPGYLLKSAKQ